jgi:hypothetical protein
MSSPTLISVRQKRFTAPPTQPSLRCGGSTRLRIAATSTVTSVYNYVQGIWYYGTLDRSAWVDRGVLDNPVAASLDGYLYYHENGFDDGSTNPALPITAYVESSQFDIGDGDNFSFVSRLIPDITFRNSTAEAPSAIFTMKARNFPGGTYLQEDDDTVTKTASVPVEQFTNQVFMRLRGPLHDAQGRV